MIYQYPKLIMNFFPCVKQLPRIRWSFPLNIPLEAQARGNAPDYRVLSSQIISDGGKKEVKLPL